MSNAIQNSVKDATNHVTRKAAMRDLREDLNVLKEDAATTIHDAATLAKNLKDESGTIARDGVKQIAEFGRTEFEKIEDHVRNKPGQSVAIAFCAGLVFSYLMGRRR